MKESQVKSTTSFDQQFTVITVQEILVICTCSFKNSHQNSFITSVSLKEKYIKLIIPFRRKLFVITRVKIGQQHPWYQEKHGATGDLVANWLYSGYIRIKKIRIVNAYVMLQLNNCPEKLCKNFCFGFFRLWLDCRCEQIISVYADSDRVYHSQSLHCHKPIGNLTPFNYKLTTD